jgi:hypothetical protein
MIKGAVLLVVTLINLAKGAWTAWVHSTARMIPHFLFWYSESSGRLNHKVERRWHWRSNLPYSSIYIGDFQMGSVVSHISD